MNRPRSDTEHLRLKKELYRCFQSFDNSDDDETPDPGRKASEEAFNKSFITRPPRSSLPEPRRLARSVSDSRVDIRNDSEHDTAPHAPPSSTDPRTALLNRSTSALLPGLKKSASDAAQHPVPAKTTGKRKRETSTAVKPGKPQIFKDLHLFFFPNNAVHPARRMRIEKAVERGATWVQKWNEAVTHVVLDASMEYSTLTRYLRLDSIPSHITVVRESWPAECISFDTLLDPFQRRFMVDCPQPPKLAKAPSTESDRSLQVEPAKKSATKHRAETPPKGPVVQVPATVTMPSVPIATNTDRIANTFDASELETSEEFEKAINQAKLLQDIPLDDEEENGLPGNTKGQDLDDSGDEHKQPGLKLHPTRKSKYKNQLQKFQCMEKHTGDKSNAPNLPTIQILEKMADYYEQTKDEWRVRAYRKAIATLRNHPTKVTTKEQALALPNVGNRLAEKIEEIASTNQLQRLQSAQAEPGDQVLQTFLKIYGCGIVQARRWVDQGYKTLDELLQKATLTENQRIGIDHFEDFNTRIPRAEVERHGNLVRNALRQLDPEFQVIIGGSYRRGAQDSGDIDLIITRPDTNADHLRNVVLGQLVPQLTSEGFLVASLAITSHDDGSKWHGASCLPGLSVWRRLDLLLVPSEELGAALIYFSGNDIFNRSMRLLASTKGMRLNQRGLYEGCLRGPGRTKLTEGTLVEGKDEKRIFEALGVPWRPPEHRNVR